jgi:hypothetical protein
VQVGERGIHSIFDVPAKVEQFVRSAGDQCGQIVVIVAQTQTAAVGHHDVLEKRPVTILRGLQLADPMRGVRALPDVQQASVAVVLPGGFETQRRAVSVPGVTPPAGLRFFGVDWNIVEPG